MTTHVDSKLLAEHDRCMGCKFVAGRAELAPQVVQDIGDIVDFVEDVPGGLMSASASRESTTNKNHRAPDSELCLPLKNAGHRLTGDTCRGGDEARERSLNRQREDKNVDRDCSRWMSADEHLRGHSFFLSFCFACFVLLWFGRVCLIVC